MTKRLIIVSNRLPVSVREEHGELFLSRSNGGLATALATLFDQETSLWVGWTGLRRRISKQKIQDLHFDSYLLPVNLTKKEMAGYYDGYSNSILWPLAHGLPKSSRRTSELWQSYYSVNMRFAKAISAIIKPDDVIWIHDYHLFLLPRLLREAGLANKIGYFVHTPFFAPEALARTGRPKEILKGILAADLVGLQTPADVKRVNENIREMHLSKHNHIQAIPIGIDFDQFDDFNDDPEVQKQTRRHLHDLRDKRIIFSLSRLDYTKGILTQLAAFEQLVKTTPEPTKFVYRLNVAPSREEVPEYHRLKNQIEQRVTRINARYRTSNWNPVIYSYDNMGLKEIASWFQAADIHLNTPVADGMNLIVKEYIAAKRTPGVPIISSTMGAAIQLKDALIVPPNDIPKIAVALKKALDMPLREREVRWRRLRKQVEEAQVSDWAKTFLAELQKTDQRK